MIGNYINIDYEKLPKRKQEEVKEPEKDYSSIGKLLQHPQYKDIIGLYTGKSKATPVVSMGQAEALAPQANMGFGGPYAAGGGGGGTGGIMPMVGAGAASTLGAQALNRLKNRKAEEEPKLGLEPKAKDEPETGIEGKASEAELDKGIEADMQKSFFDTLKALDISVDELKEFAELYKSGLADEELPANLFKGLSKDDPDYAQLVDLLKDIIRKYPDIVDYINPNDMQDNDNNDDDDDDDDKGAIDRFVKKAREIFKKKKEGLEKDFNKFKETDPKTKRNADIAKNQQNIQKKYEYVDRSKMDSEVNKYDASKAKTNEISRTKPEIESTDIQESGKTAAEKQAAARNFQKEQMGREVKTPWRKDQVSPWNK